MEHFIIKFDLNTNNMGQFTSWHLSMGDIVRSNQGDRVSNRPWFINHVSYEEFIWNAHDMCMMAF